MNLQTKSFDFKELRIACRQQIEGFFWGFFCCFSGFNFISESFTSSAQTKGLTCYLGVVLFRLCKLVLKIQVRVHADAEISSTVSHQFVIINSALSCFLFCQICPCLLVFTFSQCFMCFLLFLCGLIEPWLDTSCFIFPNFFPCLLFPVLLPAIVFPPHTVLLVGLGD